MIKSLGRYHVVGELGRGAMGAVYRATDPLIEREVAIKTLLPTLPEDIMDEVRERFIREARSAGRLNHPNIVTIFDVGEQDGVAYIAMELLEGRSLQQVLRDPERLSFDRIAELAAQVADALDAAQQFRIVHRDVKPANIMIGPTGRAKLTDFGVAHVESSSMTQTGTSLGSPKYMSPEQVLGLPVDPRSDLFSLGVVLYEMLARRTPFERASDTTVLTMMSRIAGEPHEPVTRAERSVPAGFDPIIDRALAKKPENRYQRAGDMAADLRRYRQLAYEKTVELPALDKTVISHTASQPIPRPSAPEEDRARAQLLGELEKFTRNFEREEEARIRADQEAEAHKAAELERWSATEVRKREQFERRQDSGGGDTDPAGTTIARRSSALEALRRQHAPQAPKEDKAAARAREIAELDASLKAAYQYLEQLVKELNSVNPAAGRPYEFVYLGHLPGLKLSGASIENRPTFVEGKSVYEHIAVRFKAVPSDPAQASVAGEDILRCKQYLESLHAQFKAKAETRNAAGNITRALFTVTGGLPCEINLRGDYNASSVLIELFNVRRVGRVQARVAPAQLNDAVDDLARYAIGADDDFERILRK